MQVADQNLSNRIPSAARSRHGGLEELEGLIRADPGIQQHEPIGLAEQEYVDADEFPRQWQPDLPSAVRHRPDFRRSCLCRQDVEDSSQGAGKAILATGRRPSASSSWMLRIHGAEPLPALSGRLSIYAC